MFIPWDLYQDELPAMLRRVISIPGWKAWKKRYEMLGQQRRMNPLIQSFITEQHWMELGVIWLRDYHRHTNRLPSSKKDRQIYQLYSFIAATAQVYSKLNADGKNEIKGMIIDGLKSDKGLIPLAYEMEIAAGLMRFGYDTIFQDIEKGGGFDFLAIKDEVEVEVECKTIGSDAGRKIHRKALIALGEKLTPFIEEWAAAKKGGCLIHLTIPKSLSRNDKDTLSIAKAVREHIFSGALPEGNASFNVAAHFFKMSEFPISREDSEVEAQLTTKAIVEKKLGHEVSNIISRYRPGDYAVIVAIESAEQDSVVESAYKLLKDSAARQFSKERPGLLFIRFNE